MKGLCPFPSVSYIQRLSPGRWNEPQVTAFHIPADRTVLAITQLSLHQMGFLMRGPATTSTFRWQNNTLGLGNCWIYPNVI